MEKNAEQEVLKLLERQKEPQSRYALEWFMKSEDEHYWKRAERGIKKATILAGTSTVVGIVCIVLMAIFMLSQVLL